MTKTGNKAEFFDYVDLMLLNIAKTRRRKLIETTDIESFYNEFFNENDVEVMASGGDLRRSCRAEVLTSAAWSHMPMGAKVLDVGCGTGDNLRYIFRDQADFVGLEYAPPTAEVARRILGTRADIKVGSATDIPFENDQFDLVICIEVLEHIAEDERGMRDIARVLKSEGVLILSLPYRHWFSSYFSTMGHFRHYTRTDVEHLLGIAGLTVVQYLPNYPRWSRLANYVYICCRLYALLLRVFGVRRSPVEVRLPFSQRTMMSAMFAMLEDMRERERAQDYARLETSTFVVAKKV